MEITPEQILSGCTIDGMIVRLPVGQLDRKLYMEVANKLNLIGGTWKGGKIQGFVFREDPIELLQQITNGEKRNLKKEYQFFATPDELADKLVEMAEIKEHYVILEPSAGQGSIIKAIQRKCPEMIVDYFELMEINRSFLQKINFTHFIGEDFLKYPGEHYGYDRIIANPPFAKNQDIDHIYRMWEMLNIGGRLVTIASCHWEFSNGKKETTFRQWLTRVNAEIRHIPPGAFKESGTLIKSRIVIINK